MNDGKETKRVLIAGSRNGEAYHLMSRHLDVIKELYNIKIVITGGAKGIDTQAQILCNNKDITNQVFTPDWNQHGKAAGPIRNRAMVENSDICIFYWNGKSPGTKDCIQAAIKANRQIHIYPI